jgi:hypothetical protein
MDKEVLQLFNEGLSGIMIGDRLGISARKAQRILNKNGVKRSHISNSKDNQLRELRDIVKSLMIHDGRDFNRCEMCKCAIPKGKYEIHHTKYTDATYYDLMIVCRRCNKHTHNIGLG